MEKAGVPVVPGMTRPASERPGHRGIRPAGGLPDPAQGLGRGRRQGHAARGGREARLRAAFERARSEAQTSFGDGAVYAEKLVLRPRHVEVQVVGDSRGARSPPWANGSAASSGVTRKWWRNAPRPPSTPALRERLCAAALDAARAVAYTSCGTVEFLLAPDGIVSLPRDEHPPPGGAPVTEEVWGVDLAREMIAIALGEPLSFRVGRSVRARARCRVPDLRRGPSGRFCAVTGDRDGPAAARGPGRAQRRGLRGGLGRFDRLRPDAGKADRPRPHAGAALDRLARALAEYEISGVATTLPLFRALLSDAEFRRGAFDVQWLDRWLAAGRPVRAGLAVRAGRGAARGGGTGGDGGARSLSKAWATDREWRRTARRESLREALMERIVLVYRGEKGPEEIVVERPGLVLLVLARRAGRAGGSAPRSRTDGSRCCSRTDGRSAAASPGVGRGRCRRSSLRGVNRSLELAEPLRDRLAHASGVRRAETRRSKSGR